MSNQYYNFTDPFIPGTKVRAQPVNDQYTAIEDAFDLLPAPANLQGARSDLGVESGSGNAYVVAMNFTRLSNTEGDAVTFKATHQNSGASTIAIDGLSAVPLVRYDGSPLSSGDILSGSYYTARYNAVAGKFYIVAPAQATVVGSITYATPTGKVKLAASAGAATTLIRSDADIQLDQSIVPTWTGQHTFGSATLFADGTALLPGLSFSADPNTGLYRIGADDLGVATGGTLRWDVSTTAITSTLQRLGQAGTALLPAYSYSGDPNTGAYSVGADDWGVSTGGTLRFDISTTGLTSTLPFLGQAGSASAPALSFSGDSNTGVYNPSADVLGLVVGGARALTIYGGTTPQTAFTDGTASIPSVSFDLDSNTGLYRIGADDLGIATGGTLRLEIGSSGAVSVKAATAAVSFTVTGAANQNSLVVQANSTSSQSLGAQINGGTNSSDWCVNFANASGVSMMKVGGGGNVTIAAPSSGYALKLTPVANNYALDIEAPATSGQSFGLRILAGTGTSDFPVSIADATGLSSLFLVRGDGQMQVANGSAAAPSMSFASDTNTGIYGAAADTLGLVVGGTRTFTIYGGVTPQCAFTDGTSAIPSISFDNDSNSGVYRLGADQVAFSANGNRQMYYGEAAGVGFFRPEVAVQGADGTVSLPEYSFVSDTNTGMYRIGADNLGIATGGVKRLGIDSNGGVTIAAPSAGTAFSVTAVSGSAAIAGTGVGTGAGGAFVGDTGVAMTLQVTGSVSPIALIGTGGFTTGAQTATFSATNKPGSGTTAPSKWLLITMNGTQYYIPCWT